MKISRTTIACRLLARRPTYTLSLLLFFFLVAILILVPAPSGLPVKAQDGEMCPTEEAMSATTVEATPRTPGAKARYVVKFANGTAPRPVNGTPAPPTTLDLLPQQDGIQLILDREIQLPVNIDPKEIKVHLELKAMDGVPVSDFGSGVATSVEVEKSDHREGFNRLTIFPKVESSGQAVPIPQGADVRVVIGEKAGIKNPYRGGTFHWEVTTTKGLPAKEAQHPDFDVRDAFCRVERAAGDHAVPHEEVGLLVDWEVRLDPDEARREDEVTATGRGFGVRSAVTFWRDANFDGVLDGETETTLCRVTSDDQGMASCSFRVNSPPFAPAFGHCPIDDVDERKCNFVNAIDGHGHSSILVIDKVRMDDKSVADALQVLRLRGTVEVTGFSRPHRDLRFKLFDFPSNVALVTITVGGFDLDLDHLASRTIAEAGTLSFGAEIPGTLQPGEHRIRVIYELPDPDGSISRNGGSEDPHTRMLREEYTDTNLDNSLLVTTSPDNASPNQLVRVSVQGFIDSDVKRITVGGVPIDLNQIISYREDDLQVDSAGRWAGSFIMPVNRATTQGGERKLVVQDDQGTQGEVALVFPERTLELTPPEAQPGQTIEISGQGFPARNHRGISVVLEVSYQHALGEASTRLQPDSRGEFTAEVTLPLATSVPSRNLVSVEFLDGDGNLVVTSAAHHVPEAQIRMSPIDGPPGTTVQLMGEGFRRFTPVNLVRIGEFDVTPAPAPSTNALGMFEAEFLVPQLEDGVETVVVSAGGIVVTVDFSVGLPVIETGPATLIQDAVADLGTNLEAIFYFRNDDKTWEFYEPDFPEDSTLDRLVTGEVYWIGVKEDVEVILNGKSRSFTCHEDSCWNLLTW